MPVLLLLYPEKRPDVVTAMSLVVVLSTGTSGSIAYGWQRRIDFITGGWFALATLPGAVLGAKAVYWLAGAERVLPFVMSGILFLVSGLILAETGLARLAARPKPFSPHQISRTGALAILGFQLVVGHVIRVRKALHPSIDHEVVRVVVPRDFPRISLVVEDAP